MSRTDLLNALVQADRVRRASKAAFGREFLVETCLAITSLDETFLFDEVIASLSEAAAETHAQPPSESTIRKDLERLRETFGAIERLPPSKGERLRREVRRPSPLWDLCDELATRT
jgi:hypothetical protein